MIQRRKERSKERDRRRKKDYGTIVFVLATLETENHSNYTDKEAQLERTRFQNARRYYIKSQWCSLFFIISIYCIF